MVARAISARKVRGRAGITHGCAQAHTLVHRLLVIRHLLATKDDGRCRGADTLLLLDTFLDAGDAVVGLDVDLDLLPGSVFTLI